MRKVRIDPGVCGFITTVEAVCIDDDETMSVKLKVSSGCKAVMGMMKELGDSFDAMELCLAKPGCNALYDYAKVHFPVHVACPVLNGIIKCAEVECGLALPKNVSIDFI